jgi:hypothetical protein
MAAVADENEALKLRTEGMGLQEIAEHFGKTHPQQAARMIDKAAQRVPREHVAAHRNRTLDRYQYLWNSTQEEIERDNIAVSQGQAVMFNGKPVLDRMPNIAARRVATQILKGIRDVMGVDAPTRKVVETVSSDIWANKLAELEAEVASNDGVGSGEAAAGDSAADSRTGGTEAG